MDADAAVEVAKRDDSNIRRSGARACRSAGRELARAHRATAPDAVGGGRGGESRRQAAPDARWRARGVSPADDGAGNRPGDGPAICCGDRRAGSVCHSAPRAVVPRPHARRALELGARAAHGDHQGGPDGTTSHTDPGCMGRDVLRPDVASHDRLGPPAGRAPWPTGGGGGARPQARRDHVRDVAGRNDLSIQAKRGGDHAQLVPTSAYATSSANPGEGCPKAASAITSFRDRRIPTMIWAVRMRRRPRTHYCALSANSRLRQPDTFWTRPTRVDSTDTNRYRRLGRDLCLTTRPLHSRQPGHYIGDVSSGERISARRG